MPLSQDDSRRRDLNQLIVFDELQREISELLKTAKAGDVESTVTRMRRLVGETGAGFQEPVATD